jgi:hypothetical protein
MKPNIMIAPEQAQIAADEIFHELSNHGIINCTAYFIASYLRLNKIDSAYREYGHDGDKIAMSVYQKVVEKHLGCRTHQIVNCCHYFCKKKP